MPESDGDRVSESERLRVDLGERSYDIVVGAGLIARVGGLIAPVLQRPRVFVVTDETVAERHLPAMERALADADITVDSLVLPAGEHTKDFGHLQNLVDALLERGVERRDTLIAFGGGVIGDLVGFAAAITLRGLAFIQVPTTLLAQVDSSVGGKTGINSVHGKNLVGAFHQPTLVLADTDVLDTLPKRELLAGYAEVVKYGCIDDSAFFTWLETHGVDAIEGDRSARRRAIVRSCARKAAIVAQDERESTGMRALLNLGHTFGHALEAECGYTNELLHGEGVAIGMVLAADLSVELGYCSAGDAARIRHHLAAVGLPTGFAHLPGRVVAPDRLVAHMHKDKKVQDGRLTFILLRGIGHAFRCRDVAPSAVHTLLATAGDV
jgi:3-dehydroquinate synthase